MIARSSARFIYASYWLDRLYMRFDNARSVTVLAFASDAVLEAHNSFITATVLRVDATDTALRLDDSQLDFAGASIRAGKRGIEMTTPSAIYFSVSDMQAPEYSGDLHKIWDVRAMPAR